MIITVKNLQQQTFTIEFPPEKKVLELKEKIFQERGTEYVVEKQKLIYAGVILDDERSIASYNVSEKKFLVVMLKRDLGGDSSQKQDESGTSTSQLDSGASAVPTSSIGATELQNQPKPAEAETVDKTTEGKSGTDADKDTKSVGNVGGPAIGPVSISADVSSLLSGSSIGSVGSETRHGTYTSGDLAGVLSNTTLQSRAAESNLLMGEEYNRSVESMIEMGYSREMVERAMAASYNNPERAVEYLISGIPDTEVGEPLTLQAGVGENTRGDGGAGGDGVTGSRGGDGAEDVGLGSRIVGLEPRAASTGAGREDPFEFLRNQPQFLQMRSLVYQNPDLLHAVLQQIGQTNPALLQLISENQDAFLSMLNQPMEGQHAERLSSGRRAQLSGRARSSDTASGAGDDAGASADRAAERRAAAADAFMREREVATAAVAALTAAASAAAVERDAGGGGDGITEGTRSGNILTSGSGVDATADGSVATIRLTPQDHDAIERLKALGFPETLVLQAYFACEKDEQLAANFLISSAFDD